MNPAQSGWFVTVLSLACPPLLHAEDILVIPAGTRARVRTSAPAVLVGTVQRIDDETLSLAVDRHVDLVTLPRTAITSLEISRGMKWSRGTGGLIGAGIGAGAILTWAAVEGGDGAGYLMVIWAPIAAVGGFGIGAAIRPPERWEPIRSGFRQTQTSGTRSSIAWSLTLAPQHGGVGGSLAITF